MDIAALARRHLRDYHAREPGTCFADPDFTLDLEAAYALQAAVSALRVAAGDRVIGHKVGCTGPGTVAQFGMAGPIRGCLYESEVRSSGVALAANDFAQLAIEGEMALRIGDGGEIDAVFPVIELHHFVFRGPRKTLVELVANNGLNAGIILPNDFGAPEPAIPKSLSIRINDRTFGPSTPWPLAGGAAESLEWLRSHLAAFGLALKAGQTVLAGTPLGLYPVAPGDEVSVLVDGAPAVHCTVV